MKMKFSLRDLMWLITLGAAISGWYSHNQSWRRMEQQWLTQRAKLEAALSSSDARYLASKHSDMSFAFQIEAAKRQNATLVEEMEEVKKKYRERLEPLQRALNESHHGTRSEIQSLKDENKELRMEVKRLKESADENK